VVGNQPQPHPEPRFAWQKLPRDRLSSSGATSLLCLPSSRRPTKPYATKLAAPSRTSIFPRSQRPLANSSLSFLLPSSSHYTLSLIRSAVSYLGSPPHPSAARRANVIYPLANPLTVPSTLLLETYFESPQESKIVYYCRTTRTDRKPRITKNSLTLSNKYLMLVINVLVLAYNYNNGVITT
jgi:hypothetical protein